MRNGGQPLAFFQDMLHKCWATLKLDNPETATWDRFLEKLETLVERTDRYVSTAKSLEDELDQKNNELEQMQTKLSGVEDTVKKLSEEAEQLKMDVVSESRVAKLESEISEQEKIIAKLIAACVDAEEAERRLELQVKRQREKLEEYEKNFSPEVIDFITDQLKQLANELILSFEASIMLNDIVADYEELPEAENKMTTTVEQARHNLETMKQMTSKKGGAIFFSKNAAVYALLISSVKYTYQSTQNNITRFLIWGNEEDQELQEANGH